MPGRKRKRPKKHIQAPKFKKFKSSTEPISEPPSDTGSESESDTDRRLEATSGSSSDSGLSDVDLSPATIHRVSYVAFVFVLARNIQILQVFFLQDLQDLALNIASLALKMKLVLQDIKILQESCKKILKIIFLQDFDQILQKNYLTIFSC